MNHDEFLSPGPALNATVVARVERYVALESPTGDAESIGRFIREVAASLESIGAVVSWDRHPTGDHAVCDIPASADRADEQPILMLVHGDTVWPVGQLSTMPWTVEGDVARGPGGYDMKAGIVVVEEALRRSIGGSHRPITVIVVADEEIGSPTARELIERHAQNAHAVLGFEPPHPDGALKTARWGSTRLRMTVQGREAHAALDASSGVSAIDELVDQLLLVRTITAEAAGVLCNVGTISGGGRTNVISGQAVADIGLRFQDAATETEVLGRLQALAPLRDGATIDIQLLSTRPAWTPDPRHEALLAEIAAAGASTGQSIEGRPATGAADTNVTGRLGVPTVDGLGPIGQGAHAAHEQFLISSLAPRIELVASILARL
jgi:glutamate carboxypeptidase